MKKIEKWEVFEVELTGKNEGNPFTDYSISAVFTGEKETKKVDGFYDGDGVYKVRFMPSFVGKYAYKIEGTFSDHKTEGEFEAVAPTDIKNHGPVRVKDEIYLQYEDGAPYYSMGTTCYGWANQQEALQEQTIKTLSETCFNKIRFCIFPKYYEYNLEEPITYPYERGETKGQQTPEEKAKLISFFSTDRPGVVMVTDFDCYKLNPEHFKRFDKRINELKNLGIEADIILLHPYDKWGFATMTSECDNLYIKYMVARYGAFRNVWWSLANEYDLMLNKTEADWDRIGEIIEEKDPYGHLRSIHNCLEYYDYSKAWITHCSLQRKDMYKHVEFTDEILKQYKKPAVWDEIAYEGNVELGWGNISPEEMVRRFWEAFLRGGHAGHGETYLSPDDILWWSKGGVLHGESYKRFEFLLNILKETPGGYMKKGAGMFDTVVGIPSFEDNDTGNWFPPHISYEIHYYGFGRPGFRTFNFPEDKKYQIEVIDTYNMTIENRGVFSGYTKIDLPAREYMAIRLIQKD